MVSHYPDSDNSIIPFIYSGTITAAAACRPRSLLRKNPAVRGIFLYQTLYYILQRLMILLGDDLR